MQIFCELLFQGDKKELCIKKLGRTPKSQQKNLVKFYAFKFLFERVKIRARIFILKKG
jgi:hypothetical protein